MGEAIKVTKEPIQSALDDLSASTESIATTFSSEITGNNKLDTVQKINHIKQQYDAALKSYQTLLKQHIKATNEAVESMAETDEKLASDIQLIR